VGVRYFRRSFDNQISSIFDVQWDGDGVLDVSNALIENNQTIDLVSYEEENEEMTPDQAALVQRTFPNITRNSDEVASIFYARLFEIKPEVITLFSSDITEQKKKLMTMLSLAVIHLHDLGKITPALQDLARRHVGYGVQESSYDAVGQALIWTLERALRDALTFELKEAWAATYDEIKTVMLNAAREVT